MNICVYTPHVVIRRMSFYFQIFLKLQVLKEFIMESSAIEQCGAWNDHVYSVNWDFNYKCVVTMLADM